MPLVQTLCKSTESSPAKVCKQKFINRKTKTFNRMVITRNVVGDMYLILWIEGLSLYP